MKISMLLTVAVAVLPNATGLASSLTSSQYRYVVLYKPALTLTSLADDGPRAERKHRERRPTLVDVKDLPASNMHICGRLDRDSEGLLLLTDDGQFTNTVLSSSSCPKRYWALVRGEPDEAALETMRQGGLMIRGYATRPPVHVGRVQLTPNLLPPAVAGMDRSGSWLEVILLEGRNRQVRRMTADAGHPTIRLVRVAIGSLSLFDLNLQPGEWRFIEETDVYTANAVKVD
jgi:23S rRNA pseudouridine2457 synthase